VGTVRVIRLYVDAKVVNKEDGFEGTGNDIEDFVDRDEKCATKRGNIVGPCWVECGGEEGWLATLT